MLATHHRSLLRRLTARLGLVALLALAAVSLSRCQMVGDRLTGIELSPERCRGGTCIVECQRVANQAMRAESVVHVSNVKACNNDPACRSAEAQRHREAVKRIQDARRDCIGSCHHQGGGSGGQ